VRLRQAGVTEVVINLHHLGELVPPFLEQHANFGLARVAFSREHALLGTGGGLKQAGWFFDDGEPFLVHNVDVLSTIDLAALVGEHRRTRALATLAAKSRQTQRPLYFDTGQRLVGRRLGDGTDDLVTAPVGEKTPLGFCGVQAVSPEILPLISESGEFSLVEVYLRLAREGRAIRAFRVDDAKWRDCGRIADLQPL